MKNHRRLSVRLACFAVALVLLWRPLHEWPDASRIVLETSPFVSLCSLIAIRAFDAGMLAGMAVAAIAIFRKRWFCRYICPAGLLQDGVSRIGLCKVSWWIRFPSVGRYVLIVTVAAAVAGYPLL
jgi:polyferredoxin